jgi:pyruvate ferredoxin oxidoreductase alpha subunit
MLKVRVFRPFPESEMVEALGKLKAIAVLDRSEPLSNQGGPLFTEVRSALYDKGKNPKIINYIYGLGGRDIMKEDIQAIFSDLQKADQMKTYNYSGVRA